MFVPSRAAILSTAQIRRAATYPFRTMPLLVGMAYLVAVFAMFLLWPIDWPIYGAWRWIALISYVTLCYFVIAGSYLLGSSPDREGRLAKPFSAAGRYVAIGSVLTVVLLFPTSYLYTGRWPWEVLSALQDQGEAFRSLYDQLLQNAGQRGPIAFARAVAAPFTFAVVPFGLLYWRRLNLVLRGAVGAAAAATIILSIMRGTDREFADLFIIVVSAFLINVGRMDEASGRGLALIRKYWLPTLILALFVTVAFSLYNERKSSRLGGFDNRAYACANSSQICADVDAPAIRWMPLQQRFGASLFVLSSASGFYGLELGMEKPWRSTLGVGHSPAALVIYSLITGDDDARYRTYTFRNTFDGWSDESSWSTLILWIANDVGFGGAVVVLAGLGWLWGRLWRDATQRRNDPAAILFCLVMVMIMYLPANNQVFAAYEGYTTFGFWLVAWLRQGVVQKPPKIAGR